MNTQLKFPVNKNDHIRGKEDAPLELVEYGDYECIDCGHAFPVINKIRQEMGEDLKFVFRNFPLSKIHHHATSAAVAAEAAALQNNFWEMHDIIFQNQKHLKSEDLLMYADKIKLDTNKFKSDIQKNELLTKVESDFESGIRSGVNRTPTLFINGIKYTGGLENNELLNFLKTQLTKVKSVF